MVVLQKNHVDRQHAWVVVVAAFVQNFLNTGMYGSPAVYMLAWMDYFQVSTTEVAIVGSLFITSSSITGLVVGVFADKFGPRPVSLVGAFVGTTALAASAVAPQFWMIYLTFGILFGAAESLTAIPPVLCVQYYFEKKRPFAAGISLTGQSFGTMIMLPLLRILVTHYGLPGAMLIHAGLVANIFVTSMLYWPIVTMKWVRKNQEKQIPRKREKENMLVACTTNKDEVRCPRVRFLCKHVDFHLLKFMPFLLFLIATVLDESCTALMYHISPIKANKSFGIDILRATLLTSIMAMFSTISRVVSSFVANLPRVNRTVYLGVNMLMMGVVTAASCLAWNFASYATSMAVFGIFYGAHCTVMYTVLTDIVGLDRLAQGVGFQYFFLALSGFTQLSIPGWLIDKTQNYDLPFLIYGGIQLIAGTLMLTVLCVTKDIKNS